MPRTLSATTDTARQRPHAAVRFLMQIDFTSPSALTVRVSDQYLSALGQEWLPLVESWGTLEEALNTMRTGGRPAIASVTLFNTKAVGGKNRLSDLIRSPLNTTGTYQFAFAKITIYELLDPSHATGDEVTLSVFYLEDPRDLGDELLTLRMVDQSQVLENKLKILRITRTDFPNADPDTIGKSVPVPFGVLTNIPCLAVVAGATTTLATAIASASDPANGGAITVTDTAATAAFPSSGTVQIDDEKISYTGKTATTFTGITRGASSTTATPHSVGATIWEIRSGANAYRWIVGENIGNYKISAISDIRAGGVLQATGFTLTLDDTTLISGRSFAVINFAALPVLRRQVVIVDGIGVTDNINISITGTPASTTVQGTVPLTITAPFIPTTGSVFIVGSSSSSWTQLLLAGSVVGVTPSSVTRTITFFIHWGGGTLSLFRSRAFGGAETQIWTNNGFGGGVVVATYGTDAYIGTEWFRLGASAAGGGVGPSSCTITAYTMVVNGSPNLVRTGNAFRTGQLSGNSTADVVVGELTCDVDGIKDDASGTISGTPNLLLENPADIQKLILTQLYPGVALADLGATWTATRASLATAAYKWASLLEYTEFSKLRAKLEEQSRCTLFLEAGKWELKYRVDAPAADLTLDYTKDVWVDIPGTVQRTLAEDIKNSLWSYAQRDYRKEGNLEDKYLYVRNSRDTTEFADELQDNLELDLVQDPATADALRTYWLNWWKRQRFELELEAWWTVIALAKGEHIAIDNHPILTAHGDTALIFRIAEKHYLGGESGLGRIRLRCIEANA